MNRAKKAAVVEALMNQAGNLAEFWETLNPSLADVPADEGIRYLAALMRKMPGDAWDMRLGTPDGAK